MAYLATFHWGWLLASLLLGLAMGWIAVVHRGQGVSKVTARWLAVLVAALVAAALARVVPGRPGYWLDLGLMMFALYLAGCAVGSWLRDWVLSRSTRRRPEGGRSRHGDATARLAGSGRPAGHHVRASRDADFARGRMQQNCASGVMNSA